MKTKREPTEFEKCCMPYYGELMEFALRLCRKDASRAEDVMQDAMVKAMQYWDRFEPEGDPAACARGWLYRIVHNTFIKDYHRRAVRVEASFVNRCEIAALAHGAAPLDEAVARGEYWSTEVNDRANSSSADRYHDTYACEQVMSCNVPSTFEHDGHPSEVPGEEDYGDEVSIALARLDPGQRAVVERHYAEGQGVNEIARALGVARGTVCSRLARARAVLGELLGGFARGQYGIGKNKNEPALLREAWSDERRERTLAGRRAGKHARSLEAAEGPEPDRGRVDGVVRGDDRGELVA